MECLLHKQRDRSQFSKYDANFRRKLYTRSNKYFDLLRYKNVLVIRISIGTGWHLESIFWIACLFVHSRFEFVFTSIPWQSAHYPCDMRFNHHKSEKIASPNAFYSCAICENRNWTAKSDQFKTNFEKVITTHSTFRQSESNDNKWATRLIASGYWNQKPKMYMQKRMKIKTPHHSHTHPKVHAAYVRAVKIKLIRKYVFLFILFLFIFLLLFVYAIL